MNKHIRVVIVLFALHFMQSMHAMVFDNRYLFLAQRPFVTVDCRPSHLIMDCFIETGRKAIGPNEREIPIGQLWGNFNQGEIARSFPIIGLQNPFVTFGRPDWQDGNFLWNINGKIQTQGVAFAYRQAIGPCISVGADWLFMRVCTHNIFTLEENSIPMTGSEVIQLDEIRRAMLQEIGITQNAVTTSGFGDLDFYIRFGYEWDYTLKLRHIIAGFSVGALIPSGQPIMLSAPSTVPFGGNGYYGMYGAFDAEFEVKEDWKVGLLFRVSKRFRRTRFERMPVADEPLPYGLVVGPAQVNPGLTVIFSPYVSLENLRQGLGLRVQYTLTEHNKDLWRDRRSCECQEQSPTKLDEVMKRSHWASDYVTVAAFYDFGKMKDVRGFDPIITLSWDIPVLMVVADRVVKTNRIIIGLEFNF